MTEWGIPALYLHSMAYELCEHLSKRGLPVPHLAFAGGFSSEDHVFKALALGAPYCKAVCMGRALMIPGMVGKNTEKWLKGQDGGLPATISKFGFTKEEIFMNYALLKEKYGEDVDNIPLGAIGIYNVADKIKVGLQQIMAGSRNWEVKYISRKDIFALTEECAKITGLEYVMDAYREEALRIINA
jgi:glutamate synthase domain-containing protein 2